MLPSHFGWPHSTQPRRVSSVLTCLYRYCKGSASSGMTIPDCSCFIFSRFAAVGSLCRIVVRMRHRFLWSPMMLAWMYYMIFYDIIWYSMLHVSQHWKQLFAWLHSCVADVHHYYILFQEAINKKLQHNSSPCARARNERNMPLATEEQEQQGPQDSPSHPGMPRLVSVPNCMYTDTMYIR